jgi:hypothetical protein
MISRFPLMTSASLLLRSIVGLVLLAAMWNYVFTTWPASANRFSDLYPRWYGSEELLLHGRNPYSADVTREIQQWQRGRPAHPTVEDEGRFVYPLYVAFVLAPTIAFSFPAVNNAMFWFLLLCAGATAGLFLRVADWHLSSKATVVVLLYSLGSFAVVFGVRLGQLGLLVGLLLAASLASIISNRLVVAGVLLAFATIKPQLTVLIVPWLLGWTFGDWSRRKRLAWSFIVTMGILAAASEMLVRNWIPQFMAAGAAYVGYTYSRSVLMLLLSRDGGILASMAAVGALAMFCSSLRRVPADSIDFRFCTALVLATTLIVIPTIAPHGQVLLLPGAFLLIRDREAIWERGRAYRHTLLATFAIMAWPPLLATGFSLGALRYGAPFARRFWLLPVGGTTLLPLAVTAALVVARRPMLGVIRGQSQLVPPVENIKTSTQRL